VADMITDKTYKIQSVEIGSKFDKWLGTKTVKAQLVVDGRKEVYTDKLTNLRIPEFVIIPTYRQMYLRVKEKGLFNQVLMWEIE
jgi:hypothetical protein